MILSFSEILYPYRCDSGTANLNQAPRRSSDGDQLQGESCAQQKCDKGGAVRQSRKMKQCQGQRGNPDCRREVILEVLRVAIEALQEDLKMSDRA